METKGWLYIAPQRIRDHKLALPRCETWPENNSLNLQRLARVFEFRGCIGFIGSGASADLGYPPWAELLPREKSGEGNDKQKATIRQWDGVIKRVQEREGVDHSGKLAILKELSSLLTKADSREQIQPTQALQIAEKILGEHGRRNIIEWYLRPRFTLARKRVDKGKLPPGGSSSKRSSPFRALMGLPLRRFITTNYDMEIERALSETLGPAVWKDSLSFEQSSQEKMAIFAVALASKNRHMVFHCHGTLESELQRFHEVGSKTHSSLVLTAADYNHWYLSKEKQAYTFQRAMEVILQSNPLLFVGYSLSDVDLLRTLRQANLRWESERIASNLFLFLRDHSDNEEYMASSKEGMARMASQIKLGVNLLPYPKNVDLATALKKLAEDCSACSREWMIQPRVKRKDRGPSGMIMPRPSPVWAKQQADPLFPSGTTPEGSIVNRIAKFFETFSVVALIGGAGSGKLLKACQFAHYCKDKFEEIYVFHSYNNDDIYSYLKRLEEHLSYRGKSPGEPKRVLVVINNIDLLLGGTPGASWNAPNKKASDFLIRLVKISMDEEGYPGLKVIVTARSLAYPLLNSRPAGALITEHIPAPSHRICEIPLEVSDRHPKSEDTQCGSIELDELPFPLCEVMFNPTSRKEERTSSQKDKEKEFHTLRWWLQHDNFGLVLAARYLDGVSVGSERKERLDSIMEALRSNSSEMGTRVVRHLIRHMDGGHGRDHETLLSFLSCFNTPITSEVFDEVCVCRDEYLLQERGRGKYESNDRVKSGQSALAVIGAKTGGLVWPPSRIVGEQYRWRFLSLGLVQRIGPNLVRNEEGEFPDVPEREVNYVVPPLVKRYFREILEKTQERSSSREFGLHGLLSKGPFNSPGCSKKPKYLFDHFAKVSYELVNKRMCSSDADVTNPETEFHAAIHLRAMLDILRSNFACNSAPLWGEFRDYIDMLSISIDLLRNFARVTKDVWYPGENRNGEATWVSDETKKHSVVASADEMLHLYNELGLAYYQTGSVQDALRAWGLATDWRKAISREDPEQGEMYNATLNAHLGTAYMQLGRMQTARECFERALESSVKTEDPDLGARMEGMIARIDHFGGSVNEAGAKYQRVIAKLGEVGNRRAECYFMRHLSALELRFGDAEVAEELANKSMAIAASENAPDLIAFASELKAKVFKEKHENRKALREYGIALAAAEKLDIARLQIDIQLGTAEIQLRIGDVRSARASSLFALKRSNEHLLVLRQVRALILLGKVAQARSEVALARSILQHACDIAIESRFRLSEQDAREALAGLSAI